MRKLELRWLDEPHWKPTTVTVRSDIHPDIVLFQELRRYMREVAVRGYDRRHLPSFELRVSEA